MRSALGCTALGLALLVVAGTFDAEPLYVTGATLALLGLGALAWIFGAGRGASVTRELGRRSVVEGEPLRVLIEIRSGRLPLPPGHVADPLLPDLARVRAGRRRLRVRIDAAFERRGRRTLEPTELVLRDPLGLAQKVVRAAHGDELLVLPRTEPVRTASGGGGEGHVHVSGTLSTAAETEVDGLRPYRQGVPASRIHWAALARGHGLMERRMIAEGDARPLVVLDARAAGSEFELDAAVRATASLALHFARQGGCGLLLPGERRAVTIEPELGGWPAAHARLALVQADSGAPALAQAGSRRGLVVFVAARLLDRPPRALGRLPGGGLLVVPGELPGRRASMTVAGCSGYALAARARVAA